MGADTFFIKQKGITAKAAFKAAVEEASYEHGHSGYTGTIAEKGSFIMIEMSATMSADEYADKLIRDSDPRIDSKWGPAGCIEISSGNYLFFGWASS